MHVGAYRRPEKKGRRHGDTGAGGGGGGGGGGPSGDYTQFRRSLSVVVKRGPRAAIGATRDEF